ncbi:hypothetical protein EDC19_0250 [Natranaerovirga hydrolytica]|uniref:Uncharacterized protein n=1 Tax=Natranaerovirga hydrolytica TaxID=680378 RepID=A0A4R1MX64_9FIRM|nr:hypothetical protein [Natranaerovirga hydrolytica]TCK97848.1 hypothetical protein EDC19_0250 [Natranaerovirga hydrolytica]
MWHETLYMSEHITEKEKTKIVNKINKEKNVKGILCLCLTNKKNFQLEILKVKDVIKEQDKANIKIIGIAKDKEDAFNLTQKIIEMIYNETKDVVIKKYFLYGEYDEKIS